MACKYCHKTKKVKLVEFVQGRNYQWKKNNEIFICAKTNYNLFTLISLTDGNRFVDPVELAELTKNEGKLFTEVC